MRSMMAEAAGTDYQPFGSLAEARADPDGVVVLEGDMGGQIYLVVRAAEVACSEDALEQLLRDLDAREWPNNDSDMSRVCFERRLTGAPVAGGMGGGIVTEGAWVHPRLRVLEREISEVLGGKRMRLSE